MLLVFVVLNSHNAYTHCVEESVIQCHTEHHQDNQHCDQLHSSLYNKTSVSKFDNIVKHLLSVENQDFEINPEYSNFSFYTPQFIVKDTEKIKTCLLRAPPVK